MGKYSAKSRLAKGQQSRAAGRRVKKSFTLVTETLIFWGAGIGLILLFVMAILPALIHFTANLKMKNSEKTVKTQIIQTPIVNMPKEYSSDSNLVISGYAGAGLNLYLVHNGEKTEELKVPENGEFSIDITLNEGENTFSFYLTNDKGDQSNNSTQFSVTLDHETPTITLDDLPSEVIGRDNQNLTLKGTTEPNIEVYINNRLTSSNHEGKFESKIYLDEGENTLTIKAVDKAENSNELVKKVNFKL